MTTEEIDRLREKLGDEFELVTQSPDENDKFFVVIAKKKDPWEGVEFSRFLTDGSTRKIEKIEGNILWLIGVGRVHRSFYTPATEEDHVSYLKATAKELYGEISAGDEFEREWALHPYNKFQIPQSSIGFEYYKKQDSLTFNGECIYHSGQWAKKVERVRVKFVNDSWDGIGNGKIEIGFVFELNKDVNATVHGEYLAKCLQDKLNEK
jgi:hypothetical protein